MINNRGSARKLIGRRILPPSSMIQIFSFKLHNVCFFYIFNVTMLTFITHQKYNKKTWLCIANERKRTKKDKFSILRVSGIRIEKYGCTKELNSLTTNQIVKRFRLLSVTFILIFWFLSSSLSLHDSLFDLINKFFSNMFFSYN